LPSKRKPSHDQVIRERWLRGRLDYKLHAGQVDLKNAFLAKSKGKIFVNECGRQFGKTYFWVLVACATAIQTPKARIKFGTAFLTDLVEFIIPAFDAVTSDCPEDLAPIYKSARSKYIFPNGSEIKLVGLDKKPNGMRGNVIDLIIIDEAGFTDKLEYLYKSVIVPATTHRPNCRIVMSSSTPKVLDHPFFSFVQKAEFEGAYILKTVHDNPMVSEATKKELCYEMGGEDSEEWRTEYLCERIRDKNLTIIPEWQDSFVKDVPRDERYGFYHKYEGMDLGVKDNTACIFGYYDFLKASLIIEDELVVNGPELTTELLQNKIKNTEKLLWAGEVPYLRISDNNNPLLLQDLSHLHRLHFVPTDKGSLEEMVNTVRMMIKEGRVIVHPRCKQLIGSLKYGVWDKNRAKFAQSKVYGHFDALAALIYLVRNLNTQTNPIPRTFNVDTSNQMLLVRPEVSETARALKHAFGLGRA
jgi:hypothetical protein